MAGTCHRPAFSRTRRISGRDLSISRTPSTLPYESGSLLDDFDDFDDFDDLYDFDDFDAHRAGDSTRTAQVTSTCAPHAKEG
ncbi:hypothetical protein [Streptomyces sp. NBC_00568]|uniref:hypothetical protein n=1 Tax=Streptomyces sp. NBC_00568 TaxID=2975779 RepID=UPI00225269D9|nr:hypothetical protein [Streptomyces sp. NBC_00568]MCX4992662.1 hypothetical protein [Streptomyces sp. NBC_00568]